MRKNTETFEEAMDRIRKSKLGLNEQGLKQYAKPSIDHYYWVWGIERGRRVLWGPYYSEQEAQQQGFTKLTGDFEVVALKTRDEASASRMLRSRLLDETGDSEETFKRFKHR